MNLLQAVIYHIEIWKSESAESIDYNAWAGELNSKSWASNKNINAMYNLCIGCLERQKSKDETWLFWFVENSFSVNANLQLWSMKY